MAKPWATSHLASVAAGLGIESRISGEVKETLVKLLEERLEEVTSEMEDATLADDPGRKTLDDPQRTRLGFSRTRGMMVENILNVDSVGAAAVVAANEQLESFLVHLLRSASEIAAVERVGTIKPRHLDKALEALGRASGTDNSGEPAGTGAGQPKAEDDAVADALNEGGGGILTPQTLRQMARSFAGGKRVHEDALEELILLYYDHADEVHHEMKKGILGGDPATFIEKMGQMQNLFMLSWMRRMLKRASKAADDAGSRIILVDHIVNLDPWA